jgi:type VI protein secretion system component VasK
MVETTTMVVPVVSAAESADPVPGSGLSPLFAVVVALIALAGVVYTAVMQRKTGRETVREARKAADAALASAEASDRAATASAAAVTEARRADAKLEVWRQREETMRMVRWGLQQAASPNPKAATIGQNTLTALLHGTLVQPADSAFVQAVTEFVTHLVDEVVDTEVQNALSGYDPEDEFELNNGIID